MYQPPPSHCIDEWQVCLYLFSLPVRWLITLIQQKKIRIQKIKPKKILLTEDDIQIFKTNKKIRKNVKKTFKNFKGKFFPQFNYNGYKEITISYLQTDLIDLMKSNDEKIELFSSFTEVMCMFSFFIKMIFIFQNI